MAILELVLPPDPRRPVSQFFSGAISAELASEILREDRETIIFEQEGLAVAVGLHTCKDLLIGRRLVVFTENQSAQACLIRFVCSSEESLDIIAWIERVSGQSDPLDILSREIVQSFMSCTCSRVDVHAMWRKCLDEKKDATVYGGEWRDGITKD